MARTSAKRSADQVIRTYAAADRAQAERSYLRERQQAATRGWVPKSRRWRSEDQEHVLTVVYESVDLADPFAEHDVEPVRERAAKVTSRSLEWSPQQAREREASRLTVETLELHCAGEPLRLIRSGYPAVPHLPIEERRAWAREHADHIRQMLMYEPRGHRDMYGAVLLPPDHEDSNERLVRETLLQGAALPLERSARRLADGSVHFLTYDISPSQLRAMMTIDGGELIPWHTIE